MRTLGLRVRWVRLEHDESRHISPHIHDIFGALFPVESTERKVLTSFLGRVISAVL